MSQTSLNRRQQFLRDVDAAINGSREVSHGTPENTFERIALLWTALLSERLNANIKATDVALMMACMKIARLQGNPAHVDSWLDLAGYATAGYDVSVPDRTGVPHLSVALDPIRGVAQEDH